MSIYSPPTQNVAIFDTELFNASDNTITQGQADKRYLRFPVAQGNETLQAVDVNGVATFKNNIIQTGTSFNISQTIPTSNTAPNTLKPTLVKSNWGRTLADATLTITDDVSGNNIRFFPNLPANNYNSIVQTGDPTMLGSNTTAVNSTLVATVLGAAANNGMRINTTSTTVGYGSSTSTATNAIVWDASGVRVRPSLTYPNNTVQDSAFTGLTTAASYTNTNMTVDANGKITAISSGTAIPFVPKAANYSDYQTVSGSGAYSVGTEVNCGGTWGELDYIILRITAQGNWGNTGTGWQNFAITSGQLIFRPFYAPTGTWAGQPGSGTSANYTTNSGNSNIGSTGKTLFYTGAINNGTQGYFYINGVNKTIRFNFASPSVTGGWAYTHLIEYITHTTSGGTVTFTNGSGTNSTNDTLP